MTDLDNRVLVIGLDGATWDVLTPWIEDGTLPNLARLKGRSSWGVLRSTIPPITAAAWSTFITGKRPGKHGVFHFLKLFEQENGGNGAGQLVSAESVKSPAIWDVLAHHDRAVGLINIPLTYPPRPVNGFMITGLLTPRHARIFTYPADLSNNIGEYQIDLERFMGKTPFQDDFDASITSPSFELLDEFNTMLENRTRVCFDLIGSRPWDFFMVVFTGTDRLGHYFWNYHGPVNAMSDNPALTEGIRRYYIRLDEVVGELVGRAGRDTTVVVMSDHGMGPVPSHQIHINNWLKQEGWLTAQTVNGRAAAPERLLGRLGISRDRVGRLVRRMPRLLKSRWVRQAANRRTLAVDSENSTAYAIPIFFNMTGIRLNRPDGPEKDRSCVRLREGLSSLVDPETGQPVITRVLRGRDYYDGPCADNIPDIIAIANPDFGFSYPLGFYSSVVTRRSVLTGPAKHRMEGIFMMAGPDVKPNANPLPGLQIEDVAPTILHAMGVPVQSDMDGRVLEEVFSPASLQTKPVTLEAPRGFWPAAEKPEFTEPVMSAEDEALIQNQLRSLGYLE